MANKAYKNLGFIKRWSNEFVDSYVTKLIYISFVRPNLEYGSIIWNPTYTIHSNLIESVQKQFLLFCLKDRGWDYAQSQSLPPYEYRLRLIKLPSLNSRRSMLNVTLILNIIQGKIVSDFIMQRVCFSVPIRRTRNYKLLRVA